MLTLDIENVSNRNCRGENKTKKGCVVRHCEPFRKRKPVLLLEICNVLMKNKFFHILLFQNLMLKIIYCNIRIKVKALLESPNYVTFSPQISISSSVGVNIMFRGLSDVTRSKPRWKARNCFATTLFSKKSA